MKWIKLDGVNFPPVGEYVIKCKCSFIKLDRTWVIGYIPLTEHIDEKTKKVTYRWGVKNQIVTHYLDESN